MSLTFSSRHVIFFPCFDRCKHFRGCVLHFCVLSQCCPARSLSVSWLFLAFDSLGDLARFPFSSFLQQAASPWCSVSLHSSLLATPLFSCSVFFPHISQIYTWKCKNLHLLLSLRSSLSSEHGWWQVYSTLSDCVAAAPFSWITDSWRLGS